MGARLRNVLVGLLEERLLDEPTSLHFALQPPPYADDGVWVAVCERAALAQALQQLAATGHVVHRLVPECVPNSANSASLWITGDANAPQALWSDAQGVHRWPLPAGATHASAWPAPVAAHAARASTVWAEPAVAAWAEQALEHSEQGGRVQVQTVAQRLEDAAQAQRWNLAQGSLSLHKPWSLRLQQGLARLWSAPAWRPARWMAASLLLVQLVGLNAAAWQARRQEAELKTAIAATLTRSFPHIQVVVDAPVQMQRAVAALAQGSGAASPQDLDAMLQTLHQNLPPALDQTAPTAINFEAGQVRLAGLPWNEEQTRSLAQALRSHQLTLRQDGNDWLLRAGETQ
jgi:general secretion pathway protein L